MQALGIAPARHHASGELVDDDDLSVPHDVVLVALEELVGAQRLIDVMDQGRIARLVERTFLHHADRAQELLGVLVAGFGQIDGALLLVEFVIFARQLRDDLVDGGVKSRPVLGRTRDDERSARLVDQDRVDFVDDGEGVAALDHLRHVILHIVAEIVEPELVVRAVGDVGGVGLAALLVVEPVHDDADGQAEELVDLAHPLGVAAGEVIVDGDDVNAFAGERIQIDRQSWRRASCLRRCASRRSRLREARGRRSAGRRNDAASACVWPLRGRWRRQARECRRASCRPPAPPGIRRSWPSAHRRSAPRTEARAH